MDVDLLVCKYTARNSEHHNAAKEQSPIICQVALGIPKWMSRQVWRRYYLKVNFSVNTQAQQKLIINPKSTYHNGSLYDRPLFFSPPDTQLAHRRQFSTTPPAAYQTQHDYPRHRLRTRFNQR